MADKKLTELMPLTSPADGDLLYCVDVSAGVDCQLTLAALKAYVAPDLSGYATAAALSSHEADHANPHAVTKAQVGLANVDDTSDEAKPISSAAQAALDVLDARLDALETAPKPIVPIARWVLARNADLTTADAPAELVDLPAGYTLHSVRVNAATNPAGGGFGFNITRNASSLFTSAQSHPANSTASAAYTGFALSSLAAGDLVGLSLGSAGAGVRHVVVTLYGREAS